MPTTTAQNADTATAIRAALKSVAFTQRAARIARNERTAAMKNAHAAGATTSAIAAAAGIDYSVVHRVLHGRPEPATRA